MAHDSRPDTEQHIAKVRMWLTRCTVGLLHRARDHDASKLQAPELEAFDRLTPKLAATTVGSPEYERARGELGEALMHHYANNSHHPEHWPNGIPDMSLLDLLEMICDWRAAGERHDDGGDLHRSIEVMQTRFGFSDELASIFHRTADELDALAA